jgi:hypothetical protein
MPDYSQNQKSTTETRSHGAKTKPLKHRVTWPQPKRFTIAHQFEDVGLIEIGNFLATGLLFLAIAIIRLQQDLFQQKAAWPVSLLVVGIMEMAGAANYSRLKIAVLRMVRRRS